MVSCFQVFVKGNVQSSKISKVRRYNPKPLEAKIIPKQRSNDLFNTKKTKKKNLWKKRVVTTWWIRQARWGFLQQHRAPPKKGHPKKSPQRRPPEPLRKRRAARRALPVMRSAASKGRGIGWGVEKISPRDSCFNNGFFVYFLRLRLASLDPLFFGAQKFLWVFGSPRFVGDHLEIVRAWCSNC